MRSIGLLAALIPIFAGGFDQSHGRCPGTMIATPPQCCRWLDVRDALQAKLFDGGKCGKLAVAAIRLTFHDAIGLSTVLELSGQYGGGGADGSIIKYHDIELAYPSSRGLGNITFALKQITDDHNASYGDIIQFAAAVGLSNCAGSPRLQFLAGRPEARYPSPPFLVPSPADSADKILSRMADAGFTVNDTVALLAAHSIARQGTIDLTVPGMPLDSTPERFDSQFYLEVLLKGTGYPGSGANRTAEAKSPFPYQFRLASDAAIARAPITACKWQSFIGNQQKLESAFRQAMIKLANNGQNIDGLVDCSATIPVPKHWDGPATFPSSKTPEDLDHSCSEQPFPVISTASKL